MANHGPREPRDNVSREKSARSVYVPPSQLPDPTPEPGYGYRWIATAVLNEPQHRNVSTKLREGWEPVKAADHPELAFAGDKNGNVEIGGLMLCKMPIETIEARARYYGQQTNAQMEAVDSHFMQQQDPRMPLFSDKKTEVSRGRGSFGNGTK